MEWRIVKIISCFFVVGWFCTHISISFAQTTEKKTATAIVQQSPLLVLMAATDESSVKVERQLVAELRLTLDGLQVEQIVIERKDFLKATLPEQLEVVQPLIRRFGARAAVWVTLGGTSGHLIQFVITEQGNATVRTVEAGSPEELALAVSELMEQSYLFEPKPSGEEEATPAWFSVGVTAGMTGGIWGQRNSKSLAGGVALQTRFRFSEGLFGGINLAGKLGPRQEYIDGILSGSRVEPGVFCTFLFAVSRLAIGPYAEIAVWRSTMNMILGGGDYLSDSWWSFRGGLGVELLVVITDRFSIFLDATVGGIAKGRRFKRDYPLRSEVLSTPYVDYSINIGVLSGVL